MARQAPVAAVPSPVLVAETRTAQTPAAGSVLVDETSAATANAGPRQSLIT
jgi:hypothetical protein